MKGESPLRIPGAALQGVRIYCLTPTSSGIQAGRLAELLRTAGSGRVAAGLQAESAKPTLLTRATHADEDPIQAV